MLGVLAMAFTADTESLVVAPIRDMTNAIRNLATYEKAMKMMNKKQSSKKSISRAIELRKSRQSNANDEALETDMMQGTIKKLARLLELGFGVAGQDIVRKVIAESEAGKDVDFTQTQGQMIEAIFGFCIIRDFADTLQVLQGEIMVYVNQIAEVVHSIVHKYSGAANKNIGNAFLCVWKLPDPRIADVTSFRQALADQALLAYLKIIIAIHENETIQAYSQLPEMKKLLPDFKVELGFGLHVGWGIEGAIGSKHKIDASYLSPNVNMAARLESGTHQFGVHILLSDQFVQMLSPGVRKYCRQIDHACVKGI